MKKIIILKLIIFGICFSGFSQSSNLSQLKNWELIGFGKSAERFNDKYSAIDYYSEFHRRDNKNNDLNFKLANLYYDVKDFENAKPIFLNLYKQKSKTYPNALFKYAQILKIEEQYDSAVHCFEIYRDELIDYEQKSNKNFHFFSSQKEIEGCEYAAFNKMKKTDIQVYHLNKTINKAYKETAPFIWNDSVLIYSSILSDSLPIIKINDKSAIPLNKFYSAKLINNKWEGSYPAPEPFFNFDSLSTSDPVFSDDHKRFYFTAGTTNYDGKLINSIYVSESINGHWQTPQKLNAHINLKKYTSSQPTIGKCYIKEYDVIYFVSDRPGGFGGMDIWYTIYDKKNSVYKLPVNAGSYINTPRNEVTPYFDKSTKSLYFSSDGLSGYGGYDIFKTIGELVNWIPSKNVGLPINSPYDDIYYTQFKKDTVGFIVSNRSENTILKNPNCCYDIFRFELKNKTDYQVSGIIYETDQSFYENLISETKLSVSSEETKPAHSSKSVIELHIENKNNGEFIYMDTDTTDTDGSFNFNVEENQNYLLTVSKDEFTPTKIKFNTNKIKERICVLKPVTIIPIQEKKISLENIYFEFNQWDLTPESKTYINNSLLKLLNEKNDIVIEISAHTDGIGDSDSNLVLSKNRAENVVEYLTLMGIKRTRIIAKGYGEAKPIANEFTETGEDKPEARALNRRIEFKVVGLMVNSTN